MCESAVWIKLLLQNVCFLIQDIHIHTYMYIEMRICICMRHICMMHMYGYVFRYII